MVRLLLVLTLLLSHEQFHCWCKCNAELKTLRVSFSFRSLLCEMNQLVSDCRSRFKKEFGDGDADFIACSAPGELMAARNFLKHFKN